MDTNMALAGSASGRAVLVGAEYGRGVHDTPPGYAGQHCHEKYVWTPVCFTTSPHHGLVQSYRLNRTWDYLPLGDGEEVFGQHGTGVAYRGELLQRGILFAH